MSNALALLFGGVQTLVVVVSVAFAWVSIRKFRDSRGIDFILNAESAIDPLRHSLTSAPPEVIRNIYSIYDIQDLSDTECQAFPFMFSLYSHVSRMCYILTNRQLDLGMTSKARTEVVDLWMKYLALFKDHPAMIKVHSNAQVHRDYNEPFLELARRYLGIPGSE